MNQPYHKHFKIANPHPIKESPSTTKAQDQPTTPQHRHRAKQINTIIYTYLICKKKKPLYV